MKPKSIFFYILFFLVSSLGFVFLLFPGKEFAVYLSQVVKNQNLALHMDDVKPAFPFTLGFENTTLLLGPDMDQGMQIIPESFQVFLDFFSIFKEEKQIKFQSGFSQGSLKGHLLINSLDPFLFSSVTASMSVVKIVDFRYKTDFADISLGCELNGEYKQISTGNEKDLGKGSMSIRNFSAVFSTAMKGSLFTALNIPAIDFSDITLEFIHQPARLILTRCTARGSIINVKLKGGMDIVFPVQKTRLNLSGVLLPDSPYLAKFANYPAFTSIVGNIKKEGILFTIKGTLENPELGI